MQAEKLKTETQPVPVESRAPRKARPRPERDAFEAGRDAMDRHPIVMARLAE